jgi:hypothetical protein
MTRTRALAWFAIAAQVAFTVTWLVLGPLEDGYSHLENYVSELGAEDAANPDVMNAAIVVLGLSIAALGPALLATLPDRASRRVAAALFVAAGAGIVLSGPFNVDCSTAVDVACEDRWESGDDFSTGHWIHSWAGFVAQILFMLTPFALARALWNRPAAGPALASGLIGIGIFLAATVAFGSGVEGSAGGLVQRFGLLTLHLWVAIVAVGVLWETRRPPKPVPLTPMRPSEFFGSNWTGEGEVVPWPYFFWRRFPQRVRLRRDRTILSDEAWHFRDRAWGADGALVEERLVYCTLVAPDRVRITADKLLDGTEVQLEEGGYRIVPYRVTVAVGPVHFGLSVRDWATVEDGTLINWMRVSWYGLPVARVELRARPEPTASNGS